MLANRLIEDSQAVSDRYLRDFGSAAAESSRHRPAPHLISVGVRWMLAAAGTHIRWGLDGGLSPQRAQIRWELDGSSIGIFRGPVSMQIYADLPNVSSTTHSNARVHYWMFSGTVKTIFPYDFPDACSLCISVRLATLNSLRTVTGLPPSLPSSARREMCVRIRPCDSRSYLPDCQDCST